MRIDAASRPLWNQSAKFLIEAQAGRLCTLEKAGDHLPGLPGRHMKNQHTVRAIQFFHVHAYFDLIEQLMRKFLMGSFKSPGPHNFMRFVLHAKDELAAPFVGQRGAELRRVISLSE